VIQEIRLQQIIGVDKKNPFFTVCRQPANPSDPADQNMIRVFFGAAVLRVIPEERNNPEFKLMIAELYNANVKVKCLTEAFGFARTTMKRWGDALKSGDLDRLLHALSGPGAIRKLTPEIKSFVTMRFPQIYELNHYDYSKQIREEINKVFEIDICSETLRPILKKLKEPFNANTADLPQTSKDQKRSSCFDSVVEQSLEEDTSGGFVGQSADNQQSDNDNRNNSLVFSQQDPRLLFCNHVGVLLFSSLLEKLNGWFTDTVQLIRQWLVSLLLGAVNIEQTKLLDFNALDVMFDGRAKRSLHLQRQRLSASATQENLTHLLSFNADLVNAKNNTVFYYDPHAKHYTGAKKILKGWCAKVKNVSKVVHLDFIHTLIGEPIYVYHSDNFHDLRERFPKTTSSFREMMGFDADTNLTFIIDRGIFKIELFSQCRDQHHVHIVSWEKNYKKGQWDDTKQSGTFVMTRTRNSSTDLQEYHFRYIDRPWHKDSSIRQLIVKATNPNNRTIEVSVLATDPKRDAEFIIKSIFKRWLQENDFKYLDTHFGINEITSYGAFSYQKIKSLVEDKQIKSGQMKALERQRNQLKLQLGRILTTQHLSSQKKNVKRETQIEVLSNEIKDVETQMSQIEGQVSRLQEVIDNDYVQLNTQPKSLMDGIKIIARNTFYKLLESFRPIYDNLRDDHSILRNLTQSNGFIFFGITYVDVILCPTMQYSPAMRHTVEAFLESLNKQLPKIPDGSGRTIRFQIKKKTSKLFAIQID
jgi:hypothetical protein